MQTFVAHSRSSEPVIALIVSADEAAVIAEEFHTAVKTNIRPRWLVASLGLQNKRLSNWKKYFNGGIYVEPFMPELDDFKDYFFNALQV